MRLFAALLFALASTQIAAAELVRYQAEVFDRAGTKLASASAIAETGHLSPLVLSETNRNAPPVLMSVYPFFTEDRIVTLLDFGTSGAGISTGRRTLVSARCGEQVSFQVNDPVSAREFTVKLTPTKM